MNTTNRHTHRRNRTKTAWTFAATALATFALPITSASAQSAPIIWLPVMTLSGLADVSTAGTLAIAVNCGPTTQPKTINGVTFLADPSTSGFTVKPPITFNSYTLDMPYNRAASVNFWSVAAPGGSVALLCFGSPAPSYGTAPCEVFRSLPEIHSLG